MVSTSDVTGFLAFYSPCNFYIKPLGFQILTIITHFQKIIMVNVLI